MAALSGRQVSPNPGINFPLVSRPHDRCFGGSRRSTSNPPISYSGSKLTGGSQVTYCNCLPQQLKLLEYEKKVQSNHCSPGRLRPPLEVSAGCEHPSVDVTVVCISRDETQ
jgi:hypothetical protein